MRQAVIDTLQLCDALRKTGMERDQAEGVARALGKQFGDHVAVRSDLDAGFQGMRSEMALMRADLEGATKALNSKFNFGFGLLVALLVAVMGILLVPSGRTGTTMPAPPIAIHFPSTATLAPTVATTPRVSLTDPAGAEDRDTPSIAPDPDLSDPR